MNNISFSDLIYNIRKYNSGDLSLVYKAYDCASKLHSHQLRQSGEPYIIHPLNVAYILSLMYADIDTICAGLLHDTLEDTEITKEEIREEFNDTICELVDGVTKISKLNYTSKEELKFANSRKIITSLISDVRIVIIKLADRLHNMRTIQFKTLEKQIENAEETLEIFVPLAHYLGCYKIKSELEDISFRILKPEIYNKLLNERLKVENDNMPILEDMSLKINTLLNDKYIPNEIKIRTKNIYGIYEKMKEGYKLSNIHDLFALKIIVDKIDNCYTTLGVIHSLYNPFNSRFKDYISSPKPNNYRSLHSTVFAPGDRLVQTQIRTSEMDKVDTFGLTAYVDIKKNGSREEMQRLIKEKFQFITPLQNINIMYSNNEEFIEQIKNELFIKQIYVYNTDGSKMELPDGSTLIDYAYRIDKKTGDSLIYGVVNDKPVTPEYMLKNNDRIILLTDTCDLSNKEDWENLVKTSYAKKMLRRLKTN